MKFILPTWTGEQWSWKDIEIRPDPNMGGGYGLFAKESIPKYSALLYCGKRKSVKELKGNETYVMVCGNNKDAIDGNPKLDHPVAKVGGKGLYIAAYINEPPPRWIANARIAQFANQPWYITTRAIKKGEQIYASYGGNYRRNYRVGQKGPRLSPTLIQKFKILFEQSA